MWQCREAAIADAYDRYESWTDGTITHCAEIGKSLMARRRRLFNCRVWSTATEEGQPTLYFIFGPLPTWEDAVEKGQSLAETLRATLGILITKEGAR